MLHRRGAVHRGNPPGRGVAHSRCVGHTTPCHRYQPACSAMSTRGVVWRGVLSGYAGVSAPTVLFPGGEALAWHLAGATLVALLLSISLCCCYSRFRTYLSSSIAT